MALPTGSKCRVGIDVGGTFTDFVLADTETNQLTFFKEPSTPSDPSEAVERGILGVIERAGKTPADIELIVHGTTIGLNAIIQRRGAKMALVVSKGNGDVFEIGRGKLPSAFDYRVQKEDSLIPRDHVFEVPIRTWPDGRTDDGLDEAGFAALVGKIRDCGADAVSVMLLNSYRAPEAEHGLATRIKQALPDVLVSESADIWPEIREYERALVCSLNAYIHPLMNRYFDRMEERLTRSGLTAPIYITANNGGTLGFSTARSRPIDTILSGPSAGVVASSRLAEVSGTERLITFDMGGTSSDIAVSLKGTPEFTTHTMIGDFPLILPVVNVSAIGAGGGSIVWVDPQGILKVGPLSAGADPGPVCYSRGGTQPALTDCFVGLGILRPDGFLGGRMKLDRDAALAALETVGRGVGLNSPAETAEAALRIATAKMATELQKLMAQRGLDPREFTLVAYGGAGPTHANYLAEEIACRAIMVPPSPGTLCALGAISTDLKRDYLRSVRALIAAGDADFASTLTETAKDVEAEAALWIAEEGDIVGPVTTRWSADMRYKGEGQETMVDLPESAVANADLASIIELFHARHDALYGFRDDHAAVEFITLRAQVTGQMPPLGFPAHDPDAESNAVVDTREIFVHGRPQMATVYRRERLKPGSELTGPALVEQEDTTVWILPGWTGRVTDKGVIFIERTQA
ncbi:hydantoinase/oxoprolinase family protein [Martelella sp. HB161492]|uniref:hydantoinase/oxoprolinase family protein n=1 Tax=Martelella sp. HB161492 TaxID=2720726 RepID=UPI0015923DB4|nr:hydantoinase/oxoprolinase family protein [Martelella sp. HB161492]